MRAWKLLSLVVLLVGGACDTGGIWIGEPGGGINPGGLCATAADDGAPCGAGNICYGSACLPPGDVPCSVGNGTQCENPNETCRVDVDGTRRCLPPQGLECEGAPNGTPCNNGICYDNACRAPGEVPCAEGGSLCPAGMDCENGACITRCSSNAGCTDPEVCVGNVCQEPNGTCDNPECEDWQACIDGSCESFSCDDDDDQCPDGAICQNGACIAGCRNSDACDPPEVCTNNVCRVPDGNCTDCQPWQTCINGNCAPLSCSVDANCGTGGVCENGTCIEACTDSDGCTDPEVCVSGHCRVEDPAGCPNGCPLGQVCVDDDCRAISCTDDDQCPDGAVCENGTCIEACTDSEGCEDDEVCVEGRCRLEDLDGCTDGCPLGQICVDDRCMTLSCTRDDQCGDGAICESGACIPGCRNNNDCIDPNEVCYENTCRVPDDTCTDCQPWQTCINGNCAPLSCSVDANCGTGGVCENGTCIAACTDSDDCTHPEVCVAGHCRLEDPNGCGGRCLLGQVCVDDNCMTLLCTDDDQCPDGAICQNGACIAGCRNNNDCTGPGEVCYENTCRVPDGNCSDPCEDWQACINGNCEAISCANNGDCGDGAICENGTCTAGCVDSEGCEDDEVCVEGRCRLEDLDGCTDGCPLGQVCVDDNCMTLSCTRDDQCGDGAICQNGACIAGCRNNNDCTDPNEVCYENTCQVPDDTCTDCQPWQTCINGNCAPLSCSVDANCGTGGVCENGTCIAACTSNANCNSTAGEVCVEGHCRLEDPNGCGGRCLLGQVCVDDNCMTLLCTRDDQCPDGAICENGACIAGCRNNNDCTGPGEVCYENTCRVPDGNCSDPCEDWQACINGNCEAISCVNNGDCGDGAICENGTCIAACSDSDDCEEDDEVCVEGRCRLEDPNGCGGRCLLGQVCVDDDCRTLSCTRDDQCEDGAICESGTCTEGCRNSDECEDPEVCANNLCQEPNGTCDSPECESWEVCLNGNCAQLSCTTDTQCVPGGVCENGTCIAACTSNANCNSTAGEVCVEGHCRLEDPNGCGGRCLLGQVCVDDNCMTLLCTRDDQCEDGAICQNGACIAGCRNNNDCTGPGEVCYENTCRVPDGNCSDPCEDWEACINGNCEAISCANNGDCGPDGVCDDGTCKEACFHNDDCTDPEVCVGNVCREPSDDCDDPCEDWEACINGNCRPLSCTENSQCSDALCIDNICGLPACTRDEDCSGGRVCLDEVCRRPVPDYCNGTCVGAEICVYDSASGTHSCREDQIVLDACSTPVVDIDIRKSLPAQLSLGLPWSFLGNYVDIQRGATRGLMGVATTNVAFVAWRHQGAVADLAALRNLANDQITTDLAGENVVVGTFTSWDAPSADHNAVQVTFSSSSANRNPSTYANEIVNSLLGSGGVGSLPNQGTAGATQYVQAQYVLRDNGQVIVVMAVALDNEPGSSAAFALKDVAGGAALASYFDYSLQHCESFRATNSGSVDFLFVVDDSDSMAPKMAEMAEAITAMVTALDSSVLEWRAALVTSSYHLSLRYDNTAVIRGFTSDAQQLQAWLRPGSTCNSGVCSPGCIINEINGDCTSASYPDWPLSPPACSAAGGAYGGCWVGVDGYATEGMLGAARSAVWTMMQPAADPSIRLREGASLVVVILSDTDDQTTGWETSSPPIAMWEDRANFVDFFRGLDTTPPDFAAGTLPGISAGKEVRVHAIYCPAGQACGDEAVPTYDGTGPGQGGNYGGITRIQSVVLATGGFMADIEQPSSISEVMRNVVEREIGSQGVVLQKPFIGASLRVSVETPLGGACNATDVLRSRDDGFDYDGTAQTISFFGSCRPEEGSEVLVSYQAWEAWMD